MLSLNVAKVRYEMSLTFPAIENEHAWIVLSFYRNIFFTRDKRKLFKYSPPPLMLSNIGLLRLT